MLSRVAKVGVGGIVVAAVGGIMWGTLAIASNKAATSAEDGVTVLNVSRRFVRKYLGSQPEMVECLNQLSHMCVAEESGEATLKLQELVFHTTQLVYHFGTFASCTTSAKVFATHKTMQTVVMKVQRDCNALQLQLVNYVDVEMLKQTVAQFASHVSNFMAMGDVVSDTMRQRLGHTHPSTARAHTKKGQVIVEHVTVDNITKRVEAALPTALPALVTFVTWACDRDPSCTITREKMRIYKLTTHLLQLHHSVEFKRDERRRELLLSKIRLDLQALRQAFERGKQGVVRAFEEPFFILNNVVAEMRVGLSEFTTKRRRVGGQAVERAGV